MSASGVFETEGTSYDYLSIDGHKYGGRGSSQAPKSVPVHVGSKVTWRTDGGGNYKGWKVCASEGVTGGCICKPGYDVSKACAVCNSTGFDPKQECKVCTKPGYDTTKECRACKPGLDANKDCAACTVPGFDPAKECRTCKADLWGAKCDLVRAAYGKPVSLQAACLYVFVVSIASLDVCSFAMHTQHVTTMATALPSKWVPLP
jgi:hypothetical protein